MLEAEYLLFCAGKATDERGTLSLHGIFDRIYATSFPAQQSPFLIVFKLKAKKAIVNQHLKIKVAIEDNDEEVNKLDIEGDFTIEKNNSLVPSFDVGQFIFPKATDYQVRLYVNDKLLISRNLFVHSADELTEA